MKDFDFFLGSWKIRNSKLKTRFNQCTEWNSFEGDETVIPVLNGLGNIGQYHTIINDKPYRGMVLNLFSPVTKLWNIHWSDGNTGVMDSPLTGTFENNIGVFYGKEMYEGREIDILFRWDITNPDNPLWSQAHSLDGKKTWETNWRMEYILLHR